MNRPFAAFLAVICFGIFLSPVGAQVQTAEAPANKQVIDSTTTQVRIDQTTAEFAKVIDQVEEFSEKHGALNVLLVVDLDNTLLAMNQDLGSDQWFTWQETLQKRDKNHPDLVDPEFDGLLEVQGVLFALSAMHPPEPSLPSMVGDQVKRGVKIVILTSRGKEFRNSAERELKRNGYDISPPKLEILEKRGVFYPYSVEEPDKHGLNSNIISELGPPRSVTYSDGIYMTAGQDKGYMLKTLLARSPKSTADQPFANFKAIVFVDDHSKHTVRMHQAFKNDRIDLATFRYSREDGNVEKFKSSTKHHVVRDWDLLKGFIETVLVK